MSDDSLFFAGQYDGRLLDHAYRVRHVEHGVEVGFAFHDPLPYDVDLRARKKRDPDPHASVRDDLPVFDELFELDTDARGRSMLIPQLRHVIVQRASDPSISICRSGVVFRGLTSSSRPTLARLCWSVVVPIQRIIVWTEVQHPYRPRPVCPEDHADEVRAILEQATTAPPTLKRLATLEAQPVPDDPFDDADSPPQTAPRDDDGAAELDDPTLAFLPAPDAEATLSTEAVDTSQERTWFVTLDANELVVASDGLRQVIALELPFTVTLSQSRRADDTCALLHLGLRQEREGHDTARVGLTSRTTGFEHPVDDLPHAGANHPMIVEDAMRTLLARLRAAMQARGDERWR